jgi:hypothetical protein
MLLLYAAKDPFLRLLRLVSSVLWRLTSPKDVPEAFHTTPASSNTACLFTQPQLFHTSTEKVMRPTRSVRSLQFHLTRYVFHPVTALSPASQPFDFIFV